jgi:multidrug resistance efflux pump
MKNKILKTISKPKVVIPVFALIAIAVVIFGYKNIGKAPVVNISPDTSSLNLTDSLSNINLSFPKSGRIEEVSVAVGQKVSKGEILAKLSAPDAQGVISQTKGALDLAQAQYASLNLQYKNAKTQQDLIVKNAYQTLLSNGLEGVPSAQSLNVPIISGTYSCGKEGSYIISPYQSAESDTGLSFNFSGLESGVSSVKYDNPIPLGNCGLQIKFKNAEYFNSNVKWTIDIPNTRSAIYLSNKNAYDLAIENRNKILSELSATIGTNNGESVAKAQVDAATGAYEAALGAYQNNVITAPVNGTISFIDKDLKVGQSIVANKNIISIVTK